MLLVVLFLFVGAWFIWAQNLGNKVIPQEVNQLVSTVEWNQKNLLYGAKIYKKACLTCHGLEGKGDGPQAADITSQPADFNDPVVMGRSDGALFWWISNGGNDMEPFKELLTEDQLWQVVGYVRKLQDKLPDNE